MNSLQTTCKRDQGGLPTVVPHKATTYVSAGLHFVCVCTYIGRKGEGEGEGEGKEEGEGEREEEGRGRGTTTFLDFRDRVLMYMYTDTCLHPKVLHKDVFCPTLLHLKDSVILEPDLANTS